MKKQLIAAAVAATMTSVAMADISISGSANIKMEGNELSSAGSTVTENSSMNMDIDVVGKKGDTSVHAHIDVDDAGDVGSEAGTINVDKLWMQTKIGTVNVKAGDFSSCTGSIEAIKKCTTTDNKISVSTALSGWTVGMTKSMNDSSANDSFGLSGSVGGIGIKIKEVENDYTNISLSGDLGIGEGTGFYIENHNADAADSDTNVVALHTTVGGAKVSFASLDADETGASSNTGDMRLLGSSLIGDYHTAHYTTVANMTDVKAFGINFDYQGNNVNIVTGSADTTTAVDNRDFTDIVVKRALASGATLDVSYGVADTGTAGVDTTNYGAQLSVKF